MLCQEGGEEPHGDWLGMGEHGAGEPGLGAPGEPAPGDPTSAPAAGPVEDSPGGAGGLGSDDDDDNELLAMQRDSAWVQPLLFHFTSKHMHSAMCLCTRECASVCAPGASTGCTRSALVSEQDM